MAGSGVQDIGDTVSLSLCSDSAATTMDTTQQPHAVDASDDEDHGIDSDDCGDGLTSLAGEESREGEEEEVVLEVELVGDSTATLSTKTTHTAKRSARRSRLGEANDDRDGREAWDGSAMSPAVSPVTPLGSRRHANASTAIAERREGDRGRDREQERDREKERGRLNSRSSSGSSCGGSGRASGPLLSPVFSLLSPDFRSRTPSLEAFSIDISDCQSCDMELSIEVSSSITPRTREVPSRAHPVIPLTSEQEVAVLNVMLEDCFRAEMALFRKSPAISKEGMRLMATPFLQFIFTHIVRDFPWSRRQEKGFWDNVDSYLAYFSSHVELFSGRFRHDAEATAQVCDPFTDPSFDPQDSTGVSPSAGAGAALARVLKRRVSAAFVLFFTNVLRSPLSSAELTLQEEEERQRARAFKASDAVCQSPSRSSGGSSSGEAHRNIHAAPEEEEHSGTAEQLHEEEPAALAFVVDVVAARTVTESSKNNKAYQVYIVEASLGTHHGRMSHRYSNFEILHQALLTNFDHVPLPPLPPKKRFKKHTPEFVEIRRRELCQYLQALCKIPEIRDSGELHGFLLAGEAVALKPKEQSLVKQKRKIYAGSQLWSAELSSLLRRLFRDSDGIALLQGMYDAVLKAETMEQLPRFYRKLFHALKESAAHVLYRALHQSPNCERHIELLGKLSSVFPFTLLRNSLSKAAEGKDSLVASLLAHLLAKPTLGSKNVLQKLVAEVYNHHIATMETALKDAKALIPHPLLCEKLSKFAVLHEPGVPVTECNASMLKKILLDRSFEPAVPAALVQYATSDTGIVRALVQFLDLELQKRDLRTLTAFLGDEDASKALQSLLASFLKPAMGILTSCQMGLLLGVLQDTLANVKAIAEHRLRPPVETLAHYRAMTGKVQAALYKIFRTSAVNDKNGRLDELVGWLVRLLALARRDDVGKHFSVNLQELFVGLTPTFLKELKDEIEHVEHWQRVQTLIARKRGAQAKKSALSSSVSKEKISKKKSFFPRRASFSASLFPVEQQVAGAALSSSMGARSMGSLAEAKDKELLTCSDDEEEADFDDEDLLVLNTERPEVVLLPQLRGAFYRLVDEALFSRFLYHRSMGSPEPLSSN